MSDLKKESIRALHQSMVSALKYPEEHYWITSKCGSQAATASIERESIGILSMTLNTFKKHADLELEDGFYQIEKLRIAIKNNSYPKNLRIKKDKSKAETYKEKLIEAERLRAILIRAYADLNNICLDAVKKSPEYQYDLDRHNELYKEYFSLRVISGSV